MSGSSSPDPLRQLRQLPLAAGIVGGSLLLLNRLAFTPDLATSQSRADALGVLLSAVLILIGLLWQQIQPKPPETVTLEGEPGLEIMPDLPEALQTELGWASQTLLTLTSIRSLVVWVDGALWLRRGVLALPLGQVGEPLAAGPLLQRVLTTQKSVYLVDLKLFPARSEFGYLPPNAQSLLCHPLGERAALLLVTDAPRSLTARDQAWLGAIAAKLAASLETCLAAR